MSSGGQTLASIDQALQNARQQLQAVDAEVQKTSADLGRQRQMEADRYAQLARIRLEQLEAEGVLTALDDADRRANALLAERESALAALDTETNSAQQRQTELEAARQQQNSATEEAEDALEECLEAASTKLNGDPDYQSAQAAVQQSIDVAERASEKAAQAERDRLEKGRPYEEDPLFMYLWGRGYGTERYRAWLVTRFMDGLVARHIRFEPARRKFHLLSEIPRRLNAHTKRLQSSAEAALADLEAIERAAAVAAGALPLEDRLAACCKDLEALDAKIAAEESHFADLMKQREAFAAGKDPHFSEALEVLVANFRAESIQRLSDEAGSTAGHDDDTLVDQLAEIREHKRALEADLEDSQQLHSRHLERIAGLEGVRRRFKDKRYDSAHSIFRDPAKLKMMLGEYLLGIVTSDQLWRAIGNSQRFRRVARSSGRGSRRRWSGGGFSSSRRSTGGSFGGGRFRTGGGF